MFIKFNVEPNNEGHLFFKNKYLKKLPSGYYIIFGNSKKYKLISFPLTEKLLLVTNQEVITNDNISLRFSYIITYIMINSEIAIKNLDLSKTNNEIIAELEQFIHNISQIEIRKFIAKVKSLELNDKKDELFINVIESIQKSMDKYGVKIERVAIKDINFPKDIQDVFSKYLESIIRAKSDLENARTQVAAARSLKNASEIMLKDDNIKYLQWLETISKIASKGKHTFVIGDLIEFIKKE